MPDGLFKSTRMGKSRLRMDDKKNSDVSKTATSHPFTPFPPSRPSQADRCSPALVLHEPYRARVSTESHFPTHDVLSSQAPHDSGEGPSDLSQHVNQPLSVQEYPRVPLSPQNSFEAHSQSNGEYGPIERRPETQYYPSRSSSSSWSNSSDIYGSPSPELGVSSPAVSSSLPSAYNLINNKNDISLGYIHPPPAPPVQSNQSLFLSSSSSSIVPMSSSHPVLPGPDLRGKSTFSIFGSNRPRISQEHLLPLDSIKRQIRYRREPEDEKTLWRMLQSSP